MGQHTKKISLWNTIQFLIAILLLVAIFYFIINVLVLFYQQRNHTPDEIESLSASFLNIVQSIFFLTTGILAFFSYLQARETIFSPIKTEIFKLQINELHNVLNFFNIKNQSEHIDVFDFRKIIEINSKIMVSQYSKIHFGKNNSVSKKIAEEHKNLFLGTHIIPKGDIVYKHPNEFEGEWKHYDHNVVYFTEKFRESLQEIEKLINSPLLPNELKLLMEEFAQAILENLDQIGNTITEVARELPVTCTNLKRTSAFIENDLIEIWNKYNRKPTNLYKKTDLILEYINKYLHINQIIK